MDGLTDTYFTLMPMGEYSCLHKGWHEDCQRQMADNWQGVDVTLTAAFPTFISTGPSHSPIWLRSPPRGSPACPASAAPAWPAIHHQGYEDEEDTLRKQKMLNLNRPITYFNPNIKKIIE